MRDSVHPPNRNGMPRPPRHMSPSYNAILRISVEHPLLTVEQVAALLQRPYGQVSAVMRSDHFLEERAKLLMERYGAQIDGVRGQVIAAASSAIEAIRRRIADPNSDVAPETLLKAAEFLMRFVAQPLDAQPAAGPVDPGAAPQNNVTINLLPGDLDRAIEARNHAIRTIDITPQAALPRPNGSSEEGA